MIWNHDLLKYSDIALWIEARVMECLISSRAEAVISLRCLSRPLGTGIVGGIHPEMQHKKAKGGFIANYHIRHKQIQC